jgi:hypothetical protein
MTLVERETDRITHVPVDGPFDDPRLEPKFYFPEQPTGELALLQKRSVQARDARIVLADLPFVPLRNLFAKELRSMPGGFLPHLHHRFKTETNSSGVQTPGILSIKNPNASTGWMNSCDGVHTTGLIRVRSGSPSWPREIA